MTIFKLLIVDDDPWVREWLTGHIQWKIHGICEIYEAINGSHAMTIMRERYPQIVITDIKMEKMNGLELLERIRKEYPLARVILLSGYDEFEYARFAIKNGAVDYLLKPVDEKELIALIKRIIKEIEQENTIKEREHRTAKQLEKSIPILQEKYIKELLTGNLHESDYIKSEFSSENMNIDFSVFYIMIYEIDRFNLLCKELETEKINNIKKKLKRITEDFLSKKGKCISFFENNRLVIGFNPKQGGSLEGLHQICQEFKNKTGYTTSIGVSTKKSDITQAPQAYVEALDAIKRKFYLGINQIIFASNVSPLHNENTFQIREKHKLINAVVTGNSDEVERLIGEIISEICELRISYNILQLVLVRLIGILDDTFDKAGINRDTAFINYLDMNIKLDEFETVYDLKKWLTDAFLLAIDIIHGKGSKSSRKIIMDAVEYVKKNFNKDISLDSVAKVLYVNPAYLSRLFKSEVGENFTHYIMRVRIEKAKSLLRESYLKVYEISEQVGYKNEKYFSRIFRDFEGITPSEYRDSFVTSV